MIIQGSEVPKGWPFGLDSMNTRLSVTETVDEDAGGVSGPNAHHGPSSSFSSFSSSNFDTESTTSFFHDNSVSLGRLFGIRPQDDGTFYFPRPNIQEQRSQSSINSSNTHEPATSHAICVPNLLNILDKFSRNKSHSRPQ